MKDCNFVLIVRDINYGDDDIFGVIGFENVHDLTDAQAFIEDNREEYYSQGKYGNELMEDCANMYRGVELNMDEVFA